MDGALLGRTTDPVDLVRDRPFVGVGTQPGAAGGDPQRVVRPAARHPGAGLDECVPPAQQDELGHDEVDDRQVAVLAEGWHPSPESQRLVLVMRLRQVARLVDVRVGGDLEQLGDRSGHRAGTDEGEHLHVCSRGRLRLGPEHHLGEEPGEGLAAYALGVDPGDAVDVGQDEVFLDAAVGVERQILRAPAVGECGDVLARDGVQPAQAFLAGDLDDGAVGAVDDDDPGGGGSLFPEWITEVPRGLR